MIQDFIRVWLGKDAILSDEIVLVITINLYLYISRTIAAIYRQGAGIFRGVGNVNVIRGVVNLVLSIIGGVYLGLFGIVCATVISNLSTAYVYEVFVLYRYMGKSMKYELLYQMVGILQILGISSIVIFVLGYVDGVGITGFIINCAICISVSGILYGGGYFLTNKIIKEKLGL